MAVVIVITPGVSPSPVLESQALGDGRRQARESAVPVVSINKVADRRRELVDEQIRIRIVVVVGPSSAMPVANVGRERPSGYLREGGAYNGLGQSSGDRPEKDFAHGGWEQGFHRCRIGKR